MRTRHRNQIAVGVAGVGLALTLGEFIDALTRYPDIPSVPWIQLVYAISIIAALIYQWGPALGAALDRDGDGRVDLLQSRGPDNSTTRSSDGLDDRIGE